MESDPNDPKPKFSLNYWFNTTFLLPKILYWLPYSDSFSDSWLFDDCCWIFYLDASRDCYFFFLSLFITFPSMELLDILSNFDFLGPFFWTYSFTELKELRFKHDFLPAWPDFFGLIWNTSESSVELFLKLTYLSLSSFDPRWELEAIIWPSISWTFYKSFLCWADVSGSSLSVT